MAGDQKTLRALVDNTVSQHFPDHSSDSDQGLVQWLKEVADRTALMIAHWMRVGFVHGVMNTDNMSIHGLTIDYGPYGWLEGFDLDWTPNTTDSSTRRYRYTQQGEVGAWNFARLLESISPLMEEPRSLHEALDSYYEAYSKHSRRMWVAKLGLDGYQEGDGELVSDLTSVLQSTETDMTILFRMLSTIQVPDSKYLNPAFYNEEEVSQNEWNSWLARWWERVDGRPNRGSMLNANPKYVLRNWMAQLAIDAAEKGDYSVAKNLHEMLMNPYEEQPEKEEKWVIRRPEWARNRVGCSMLSCSS